QVADLQRALALVRPQLAGQPLADDRLDGLLARRAALQCLHPGRGEPRASLTERQPMHLARQHGVLDAAHLHEAPATRARHRQVGGDNPRKATGVEAVGWVFAVAPLAALGRARSLSTV